MIIVVGLSHKTAPIAFREKLAVQRDALPDLLAKMRSDGAIGEVVVLSTCNRVEVYAAPPRGGTLSATTRAVMGTLSSMGGDTVSAYLIAKEGMEAVRHLFRVASSLDSLVVGEPQILGQLKDAIDLARSAKTLNQTLGRACIRAVRVGKRVRSETAIGAGQVSVSSVAVDLAEEIFGDLQGRKAALIGAGEMAEAAARLLAKAGASIVVLNRSPARAQALAVDVGGEPRPMSELERTLGEVDIAIASTSSQTHVISLDLMKRVRKVRRGKSLFLIDIAVPRDVDPKVNELESIYLYDVDDLSRIVAASLEGRAMEAAKAEAIVDDETQAFEHWARERKLSPTIVGLFARTRATLVAELERSLAGKLKHLGEQEREALLAMVDAATNKLLHTPVTRLKELAGDARGEGYVEAVQDLFDLSSISLAAGNGTPNGEEDPSMSDGASGNGKRTEKTSPRASAREVADVKDLGR